MIVTHSRYPVLLMMGLILVMFCSALPLQAATNVTLSGVMPAWGDVNSFQISSDGRRAVYLADQDTDGVLELYSVSWDGSPPIRLNPLLPTGRSIASFQISPDSHRVVYTADQDNAKIVELYSVPIAGPAAAGIKLNGPLVLSGNVVRFIISPDSTRVIYQANQQTASFLELYSVPIAGPADAWIKLNGPLVLNGNVVDYKISPDSSRVLYRADQVTNGVFELYSVPIAGPAMEGIKLNGSLVTNGSIFEFQVSPDSSQVVYRADQQTDEVFELYSVPLAGPSSAGVKLNGSLALNGDIVEFQISPDGSRVVYQADQQTNDVFELYSVPIKGPADAGIKLNGLPSLLGFFLVFQISPDSTRVVYRIDHQTNGVFELFSVPIAGPADAWIKLNGPLVPNGAVQEFQISPDSAQVVYRADQQTHNVLELYRVPIKGPADAWIKLNSPLVLNGSVLDFQVSPNSSRVVYRADQETVNAPELYSVPMGGPAAAGFKLNSFLVLNGSVTSSYQISPDSGRVLYIADQDTYSVFELFMTSNYQLYLPLMLR